MRAVFFGTPAIAVPALRALNDVAEVVGVVCQPDKPAGRGLSLVEPAIKVAARDLGLVVHQPVKVKTGNLDAWLRERAPDVAVVLAYGRILPKPVLDAPRCGCINLHASVLPKYRGAAPIQWAILRGETETGISLMRMDEGMDTGPVYTQRSIEILPNETAGELADRLSELAAHVVREDLPRAVAGELQAEPQDEEQATLAPPVRVEDSIVDWASDATSIERVVRAMAPRPGARTWVDGKLLKLLAVRVVRDIGGEAPGSVRLLSGQPVVITGGGGIEIVRAQPEGRKPQRGEDLVHGRVLCAGVKLSTTAREPGARSGGRC